LALRETGHAENTEHRNDCRNEGKASDRRHGSASFYFCACCSSVTDSVRTSDMCISLHRKVCKLITAHLERLQLGRK
jgi:hypothetical protein